jgi:hypothetical protein
VAFGPAIRVPSDASAALWIAPTLGIFETVGGLVPQGYERYLLLDYRGWEPRRFDGVCRLFEQLVPVLASHTSTPNHCWFAIWEGHGFDRDKSIRTALSRLPSFDLPYRRYYLVCGAVAAASEIDRPGGTSRQPPDLWWPEDRRWFVGGDTDLNWCYIAGSVGLVSAVAAEFQGQTRAVDWKASHAADGE